MIMNTNINSDSVTTFDAPTFAISKDEKESIISEVMRTIIEGPFDVKDRACMRNAMSIANTRLSHAPVDENGTPVTVKQIAIESMHRAGVKLAYVYEYGSKEETKAWEDAWNKYKSYPIESVMYAFLDNLG